MKKKRIAGLILFVCFTLWMIVTNVVVELNILRISYANLPTAFEGFRIVQISDFHNSKFAAASDGLIEKIEGANPDMIAITGDLVDSNSTDIDLALSFVKKLVKIAPCYYVTGNHEAWLNSEDYFKLEQGLNACGVTILRDSEVLMEREGQLLSVTGVDDPDFTLHAGVGRTMLPKAIRDLATEGSFRILLSHRPEYYDAYKKSDANLVLSGHAHGGQFRLPFVGGLIAPNQGFFPEYDSGIYQEHDFAMVVSRGIGNSVIPVRFYNQPEVVVVELTGK